MHFSRVVLALSLTVPAVAGAAGLEIRHEPVTCVAADRYARITAAAAPPEGAARADLQFRVKPGDEWYSVLMTADADGWSAMLPRPSAGLAQFEYRIVMTGGDLATVESAPVTAHISGASACEAGPGSSTSVSAPIVVRVPPGAPLVPPVPPGFSPAGVASAAGPPPSDKWKAMKWIAGGAAAVGIGALAAGLGSGPAEVPEISEFTVSAIAPNPGGDFSLSRDHLAVTVHVRGAPSEPLTFTWSFTLRQGGVVESSCVSMSNTMTIGSDRPLTLRLEAPIRISGFCGTTYQVTSGTLSIVVDGQLVQEETQDAPFRIVP